MRQNGFSLFEVLIATAIFGVLIGGVMTVFLRVSESEVEVRASNWLNIRHYEIKAFLRSPANWGPLVAGNPAMACLATACPGVVAPQNLVINMGPSNVINGANPQMGLNVNGDFCVQFGTGDRNCIYGITSRWEALCDPANPLCSNPHPRMSVRFSRQLPGRPIEAMPSYDITVYRDPKLDSAAEICAGLNGNFTGTTAADSRCTIPQVSCNPAGGSFVLGFDSAGQAICGKPNAGGCTSPDILVGFYADGSPICTTGGSCPINQNCVGSWSACSAPCGGGTQTYTITTPASGTGAACPSTSGATRACNTGACTATCSLSFVGPTYVTFVQDTASRPRCDAIYNSIGTWCTTLAENGQVARCLDTAGGICDASGCSDGFVHTCSCL